MLTMAADGTSFFKAQRKMEAITTILITAACEWFLILLLLVDAILSYLLTKFARYCELQLPCILCSRLDHVLGNEKPDFYRDLLCSNHRLEISSLVSCQIHGKLADGYAMCDDCLLSFSTKDYSNPDMHRLYLGKVGFDFVGCGSQSSMPNRDFSPMSQRLCPCCNKPWRSRKNVQRLLQLKSPGTRATKPSIPLPHRLSNRDGLKKIRDKFSGASITDHCVGTSGFDPLSHVGYSDVKITSDSESEFPFSDDDGSTVIFDITEAKDNASRPRDIKCLTPDVWHDLAELNWQQPIQKTYSSPLPELISLDDVSPLCGTPEVPAGPSPICQSVTPSTTVEPKSLVDMKPPFDVPEVPVGAPPEKSNVTGEIGTRHFSINYQEEVLKLQNSTSGGGINNNQVLHSPAPVSLTYRDTSDGYKLVVSGKGEEVAGCIAENSIDKECDNDATDVKLSAHNSSQGINLPTNNMSTNAQGCPDKFQKTDASSCNGIQTLHKSVLVERTESADDSLDGSSVSEIEGESTIDRLKRQVEHDRRCMNALYKELDEERSASAVAANQAMAMITKLQEEKAALHMDALQYLRMMEEQAEYDVDALEKANDLLAEKEKEIQDLEAALEYFALKYPEDTMTAAIFGDNYGLKKENVNGENKSLNHIKENANVNAVSKDKDKPETVMFSWSEFQDEKLYIIQSLKTLERKLQTCACDGLDDRYSKAAEDGLFDLGKHLDKEGNSANCRTKKNGLSLQKNLPVSNGSIPVEKGMNASICEDEVVIEENVLDSDGPKDLTHGRKNDLVALENEISDLHQRVEALEDDCNSLGHTSNFLQNGNEGLSFIQEIACQLQKIRKIKIRCRCQPIP